MVFGHIFHAVGPNPGQALILGRHAEKLVAGRHQFIVAQAPTVLQLKFKPGGHSQFDDRRRRESEDHGLFYPGKGPHGAACDGFDLQVRPLAQIPVPEFDKSKSHVLSLTTKTKTGDCNEGFNPLFFMLEEIIPHFVRDRLGLLQT